jgi:hypothetical protein
MFPFSFTSFSGSKSIFVEAWNPSPNFVDNVDNVITKDPTTFFSPAKNGQAPRGPTILAKDGQTLIFVNHSTSSGLVVVVENGPTLFMGNLASFIDSANHGRYHQFIILMSFLVIMLLRHLIFNLIALLLFHLVKNKRMKGRII